MRRLHRFIRISFTLQYEGVVPYNYYVCTTIQHCSSSLGELRSFKVRLYATLHSVLPYLHRISRFSCRWLELNISHYISSPNFVKHCFDRLLILDIFVGHKSSVPISELSFVLQYFSHITGFYMQIFSKSKSIFWHTRKHSFQVLFSFHQNVSVGMH